MGIKSQDKIFSINEIERERENERERERHKKNEHKFSFPHILGWVNEENLTTMDHFNMKM